MKSSRSASCLAFSSMSTLVLVGGLWMSGCSPSEVGSAPSSKEQVKDYISQEKAKMSTKKGAGPQSIKKKLYENDAAKTK